MDDLSDHTLSIELERQIDAICAEFERAWKANKLPRIEDYVVHVPEQARPIALQELIAQDVDLRRAVAESVAPAEYHERFPENATRVEAAFKLLDRREPALAPDRDQVVDQDDESRPDQIGRYKVLDILGKGGCGIVYLAEDTELNRRVALKAPLANKFSSPDELQRLEARTTAQFEHPGIVTVYDVFREADRVVIVQQYIEGQDLRTLLKSEPPPPEEAAELMAAIAEAVSFAHRRGFVHRDLKPGNILLDNEGKTYVADFGLALHESILRRRRGELSGTPAYMSPEQVRGETHRLDGRSDIWSLGVILYEMLTGCAPFQGEDYAEVFDEILHREARPPREINPEVPDELERICLKCLQKRILDRYTVGNDLALDLRHWLDSDREEADKETPSEKGKVVPKGLRSFGPEDADFFLDILPGPRDRDGLPENIRFWKTRIEEMDTENTFSVGLIYGPSGCGKSSLVRAGLLPRLAPHVIPIYIDASAADAEVQLLRGLRRHCADIPQDVSLPELVESLREGLWTPSDQKILVVLDQFEQWLHAERGELDTQLMQALRHCDGTRVQCLLLVRDDFWLATSRFMQGLEVELVEGHNTAMVDLFDPLHARKVLADFGRAYGRLPERPDAMTEDQEAFLDRAIEGFAVDGKVICVRLALFADLLRGKPWEIATLKQLHGRDDLGVTFLEETFSSPSAPAQNRHHEKAVRAVLKELLRETGESIKGAMRSYDELLHSSGYSPRPKDFETLLRILNTEIRLITPADPDGLEAGAQPPEEHESRTRYFQLTHDYLVPAIQEWLTRKQKETRRGRAELRLAERAALWRSQRKSRQLPSLWEYVNLRALTERNAWTESERTMMRSAGRYHLVRTTLVTILLALGVCAGLEAYSFLRIGALATAKTSEVPSIIDGLPRILRHAADHRLETMLGSSEENSTEHLNASIATLRTDTSQLDYLTSRLLDATPDQFSVLRDELKPHQAKLRAMLWQILESPSAQEGGQTLQAAGALATYETTSDRWEGPAAGRAADALVSVSPLHLSHWIETLRPVQDHLLQSLSRIYQNRDGEYDQSQQNHATVILADYAADRPNELAELVFSGQPDQFNALFPVLERHGAKVVELLAGELDRELKPEWNDSPLDEAWIPPNKDAAKLIEESHGLMSERFALCQSMPLERFKAVAESLQPSGYRPVRLRPYAAGDAVHVAAVWARDDHRWRIDAGLSADEMREREKTLLEERFVPCDVAGYVTSNDGRPVERYAAVWVEMNDEQDVRLYIGEREHVPDIRTFYESLQAFRGLNGRKKYCAVKSSRVVGTQFVNLDDTPTSHRKDRQQNIILWDVDISRAETHSLRERYTRLLPRIEEKLDAGSENRAWLLLRARANYHLGSYDKTQKDLDALFLWHPRLPEAYEFRAVFRARQGQTEEAKDDLAKFKELSSEPAQAYLTAVVLTYLGEDAEGIGQLENAIAAHPLDAEFLASGARAYALAAGAHAEDDLVPRPNSPATGFGNLAFL
ncbi:MAG: protein kinase, partial [Planctomycetes bacterium]|nr:protein kinase [Planctomycetota bacterium]